MTRRVVAALSFTTLMSVVPALASGVTVSSSTLDTYRTCVLAGVSAASTAVADTFVNQASPNVNSGTATTMDVQSRTSNNRRVYVRFDLTLCNPVIPSTAVVVDAHLDLFVTQVSASCRTVDVFKMTATWAETTITWNNQPIGTSVNNPPTAQRSASTTIGASPCTYTTASRYVTWTGLTSDAQAWVNGSATNYGWMLRDDNETGGTTFLTRFSASEANVAARAPRLLITYRP